MTVQTLEQIERIKDAPENLKTIRSAQWQYSSDDEDIKNLCRFP